MFIALTHVSIAITTHSELCALLLITVGKNTRMANVIYLESMVNSFSIGIVDT